MRCKNKTKYFLLIISDPFYQRKIKIMMSDSIAPYKNFIVMFIALPLISTYNHKHKLHFCSGFFIISSTRTFIQSLIMATFEDFSDYRP